MNHKKALGLHYLLAGVLGHCVAHVQVVGIGHAGLGHQVVTIVGDILGDEAIEEGTQGIVHKLHRRHLAAMHQVGGHLPYQVAYLAL